MNVEQLWEKQVNGLDWKLETHSRSRIWMELDQGIYCLPIRMYNSNSCKIHFMKIGLINLTFV